MGWVCLGAAVLGGIGLISVLFLLVGEECPNCGRVRSLRCVDEEQVPGTERFKWEIDTDAYRTYVRRFTYATFKGHYRCKYCGHEGEWESDRVIRRA